jgi:hypothetical protein
MILDKKQRSQLQAVLTDPNFEVVRLFAEKLKEKIGTAEVLNDTEWNFTKSALQKEFQIAMIEEFFRLLEEELND